MTNKRKRKRKSQQSGSAAKKKCSAVVNKLCADLGDNLQFEDSVPDEVEEEDIVSETEENEMEDDEPTEMKVDKRVWMGDEDMLDEKEEMLHDMSAYVALHSMNVEWPSLSFDIVRDNLGEFRKRFPLTLTLVTGSQADAREKNKVSVIKVENIQKTKRDDREDNSDSESSDDDFDGEPNVEQKSFPHPGCINRIRCMPQKSNVVATWSDMGRVYLWDVKNHIRSLDAPLGFKLQRPKPLAYFKHKEEGYALDWSPVSEGRLLSGDCRSHIHLWNPREGGWDVDDKSYSGHSESVEDIQWSPNEAEVFASCSVDKHICIWDARQKKKPALRVEAHTEDVNVISWNRRNASLLCSGSDDSTLKYGIFGISNRKRQPRTSLGTKTRLLQLSGTRPMKLLLCALVTTTRFHFGT
eukprot:286046_1